MRRRAVRETPFVTPMTYVHGRSRGLVVMTFALHAKGRRFEPAREYFAELG